MNSMCKRLQHLPDSLLDALLLLGIAAVLFGIIQAVLG